MDNPQVRVNNNLEISIRRLRHRLQADGIFKRLKDRVDYPTKSGRKRIKEHRAQRRRLKAECQATKQ